jgi:predicted secreted protein
MTRTGLALCIVPLLGCVCIGCHHDAGPAPVPTGAASAANPHEPAGWVDAGDVVIGVDDDGRTVDVSRGATVTFRLPLASGTGYGWVPAPSDGGVLVQQGERTGERAGERPGGQEGGMPGGPRLDVYRFAARSEGTVIMEMQLKRPWETDTPPASTLRVTIRVH